MKTNTIGVNQLPTEQSQARPVSLSLDPKVLLFCSLAVFAGALNASTETDEDALLDSNGFENLTEVDSSTNEALTVEESPSFIDRFSNRVKSWLYPQQCLNLQTQSVAAGPVSSDDWQRWLGKPKLKTIGGTEFREWGQQENDYFL